MLFIYVSGWALRLCSPALRYVNEALGAARRHQMSVTVLLSAPISSVTVSRSTSEASPRSGFSVRVVEFERLGCWHTPKWRAVGIHEFPNRYAFQRVLPVSLAQVLRCDVNVTHASQKSTQSIRILSLSPSSPKHSIQRSKRCLSECGVTKKRSKGAIKEKYLSISLD